MLPNKKSSFTFPEEQIFDLSKKVFLGAERRRPKFESYLKYYYEGTDQFEGIKLKRLFGEINTILSLIFTPESLLLEPVCHERLNDVQYDLLLALTKEVYDNFVTYNRLDLEIEEAILHALIFGYTPIKVYWKGQGVLYKEINPVNFGVLYESLDLDDRQQVIGHRTFMTKQKVRYLYGIDPDKIVSVKAEGLQRSRLTELINIAKDRAVAQTQMTETDSSVLYKAVDAEEMVEVVELYMNEMYETGLDIWHRYVILPQANLIVKKEKLTGLRHPFFLMVLYPAYGSCLGVSLIEMIKEIQDKRIESLKKIDEITELRAYPPLIVRGAAVSPDQLREDIGSLYSPKSFLLIQDPQAQYEPYPPQTGLAELYDQLEYWNNQLKFVSGLYEIILGEGSRVRAARGLEILATFASSIFRKIAHRVETILEDIFTYTAILYQINSDKVVEINGKVYRYADFPYEYRIRIKSHTSSPIDISQIREIFATMYKMGDIPADILFDLFNLPYKKEYEKFKNMKTVAMAMAKAKEEEK